MGSHPQEVGDEVREAQHKTDETGGNGQQREGLNQRSCCTAVSHQQLYGIPSLLHALGQAPLQGTLSSMHPYKEICMEWNVCMEVVGQPVCTVDRDLRACLQLDRVAPGQGCNWTGLQLDRVALPLKDVPSQLVSVKGFDV